MFVAFPIWNSWGACMGGNEWEGHSRNMHQQPKHGFEFVLLVCDGVVLRMSGAKGMYFTFDEILWFTWGTEPFCGGFWWSEPAPRVKLIDGQLGKESPKEAFGRSRTADLFELVAFYEIIWHSKYSECLRCSMLHAPLQKTRLWHDQSQAQE